MKNLPVTREQGGSLIDYNDPKMVATLKATVALGATDEEFAMFAGLCKSTGLNPFKREVWFIKTKGYRKRDGTEVPPRVQIMTGVNGFVAIANSHPQFDGIETEVERGKDGLPIKAVAKVWRKDRKLPSVAEALWVEYYKPNSNGHKGTWEQMPSVMLAKCAKSLALREAFPQELNGLNTQEEMDAEETRREALEHFDTVDIQPNPVRMATVHQIAIAHEAKTSDATAKTTGRVVYSLAKMRAAGISQDDKRKLWAEAKSKAGAVQDGDYLLCMVPVAALEPYRIVEAEAAPQPPTIAQQRAVVVSDDDLPDYDPNLSPSENVALMEDTVTAIKQGTETPLQKAQRRVSKTREEQFEEAQKA